MEWCQTKARIEDEQYLKLVGCLLAQRSSNTPVYLRDGSAQTNLRAVTLR